MMIRDVNYLVNLREKLKEDLNEIHGKLIQLYEEKFRTTELYEAEKLIGKIYFIGGQIALLNHLLNYDSSSVFERQEFNFKQTLNKF